MKPIQIAEVCHETNRAYCRVLGDNSQPAWNEAPEWQRTSALNGVNFHLANPGAKPSDSHDKWLEEKRATGWKYGAVKDPSKKEHPGGAFEHLRWTRVGKVQSSKLKAQKLNE